MNATLGRYLILASLLAATAGAVVAADAHFRTSGRIAAASTEMAAATTEAASAAEELRRGMEQISSGAQEASSAAQQSLAAVTDIVALLARARTMATAGRTVAVSGITVAISLAGPLVRGAQHGRFDDALHEFDTISGVAEDVTDIILNIKTIAIRMQSEGTKRMTLRKTGPGDVHGNPLLVNAGTDVKTDYKLTSTSPCINAGTTHSAVTTDYWGTARGTVHDIGAHEY